MDRMTGILIIEEDDLMHALLKDCLTEAGYRVCEPGLPEGRAGRTPALVIVDVYMPRSVGAESLRAARARHPGTPLIAISGQFCAGLACCGATAHALGVERVIAKPFNRDELLEAVRAVIGPPE
jgi:two-component system, OmpR family, KDP operon response regulator KdpE